MTTAQDDLFAVLGLPRRYDVDPEDLERRFHARSRLLHPDRFARATLTERRIALERATRLNEAYRILKDSRRRAAYLLTLLEPEARTQPTLEAAFLHDQLEIRETLSEARTHRDEAAIAGIAARAREALSVIEREVAERFSEESQSSASLGAIRAALARARYHEAVLAEADSALTVGSPR